MGLRQASFRRLLLRGCIKLVIQFNIAVINSEKPTSDPGSCSTLLMSALRKLQESRELQNEARRLGVSERDVNFCDQAELEALVAAKHQARSASARNPRLRSTRTLRKSRPAWAPNRA